MSLNGIAASALTALKTNSAALGVVSNNVANINTPGYARRVVNETTLTAGGQLMGVDVASVQRVVDQFLQQENLSAAGSASQYDTQSQFFDQLNGLLGAPGDNQSLATQLNNVSAAFATASQAPTASSSATNVATALNSLASTISTVSGTISGMQSQIDNQVVTQVASTNDLIKQIYQLNQQIKTASAQGDTSSGLSDQRDVALQSLSQAIGVKINTQPDGSVNVSTDDGVNLVSNTYATLSYAGGAKDGTYGNIMVQDTNPLSGQLVGQPQGLDPHLDGGSLKGLIDMRDQSLGGLAQSLGGLAQGVAQSMNAQANSNTAYPPPATLNGRDTGLLSSDALNFTGKTTLAVTDASGKLVSRVDVDFGAGTLSVNGGAAQSIGSSIGSFTTALNGALGSNGSASFTDGQLTIAATGSNGVVVQDDATIPSSRGGTGFSQFFGLNDVYQAAAPSVLSTGLSASDASGLVAGGQISLSLKGPDGDIVRPATVTITAGMSVGDVVNALNGAMAGAANFSIGSDGSITTAKAGPYADYQLNVTADTTQRGTTGVSFSQLFGLGDNSLANQAGGFALSAPVAASSQRIGFAQSQITATSAPGDAVLLAGDASGAIAFQNVITQTHAFAKAGDIQAQTSSLSDYAAAFYQDVATQSNSVTANQTTQDDRLQEAQSRQASNSGVNLDEELTNLSSYQQAYSAGARILTVVDQLYTTLLQIQ